MVYAAHERAEARKAADTEARPLATLTLEGSASTITSRVQDSDAEMSEAEAPLAKQPRAKAKSGSARRAVQVADDDDDDIVLDAVAAG